MKPSRLSLPAAALALAAGAACADPPAADRGALLYENHCAACHTAQIHWRDRKAATDWPRLSALVRQWQRQEQLNWTDDDIEAVARYLNDRYYRFPRTRG
jgi:mono/diheme cytochrome c family protein